MKEFDCGIEKHNHKDQAQADFCKENQDYLFERYPGKPKIVQVDLNWYKAHYNFQTESGPLDHCERWLRSKGVHEWQR